MSLKKTYPPSPRSHPLSVTPQLGIGAFKGPAPTMLEQRLSWSSWLLGDRESRPCPAQELCFAAAAPLPVFAPHNLPPSPFLRGPWALSELVERFWDQWQFHRSVNFIKIIELDTFKYVCVECYANLKQAAKENWGLWWVEQAAAWLVQLLAFPVLGCSPVPPNLEYCVHCPDLIVKQFYSVYMRS